MLLRFLLFLVITTSTMVVQGLDLAKGLVLFIGDDEPASNDTNLGLATNVSSEATSFYCGGVFVSRQHVLTTLDCALSTKRRQLTPTRMGLDRPQPRSSSVSTDIIIGKPWPPKKKFQLCVLLKTSYMLRNALQTPSRVAPLIRVQG
jgi:hypothetical protein